MDIELYDQREQTAAKHLILVQYLELLALKVGQFRQDVTLNYVDGFSGPWESKADDLSDTSPYLALQRLLAAREQLAMGGRTLKVRAFFVALHTKGADCLRSLQARFPAAQIEVVTGAFEERIEDARRFARTGRDPFAFIFIDPTGFTGFGLRAIAPLLQDGHNEVLLNLMMGHIGRFIDNGPANLIPSFIDLFGDISYREAWRGLSGLPREERIVETYCKRLAQAGGYKHCVSAMILNPKANRTHYHLIYGTRSNEGLVAFREVERRGLAFQKTTRADVQQNDRVRKSGQSELFGGQAIIGQSYVDELRGRYLPRARQRLESHLQARGEVSWDDLVLDALQVPMVAEADVKQWVRELQAQGEAQILGLAPRARVPQRGMGHRVRGTR